MRRFTHFKNSLEKFVVIGIIIVIILLGWQKQSHIETVGTLRFWGESEVIGGNSFDYQFN